eukprot:m.54935 g.54935  ORF g.54935 m.54935 type:complete len:945 (+) comp10960_c0_seq1:89-2923(+)
MKRTLVLDGARPGESIYWRDAAQWLADTKTIHRIPNSVEDFAFVLHDGVHLCDVLILLTKVSTIRVARPEKNNKLRPYQKKHNCRAFLAECSIQFGWNSDDLFDPDEFVLSLRFERVIQAISRLSHTTQAKDLGFRPFPDSDHFEEAYGRVSDDEDFDSIYESVEKASENWRDSIRSRLDSIHAARAGNSGGDGAALHYGNVSTRIREAAGASSDSEDGQDDYATLDYEDYDIGGEELYDEIVGKHMPQAPRKQSFRRRGSKGEKRDYVKEEIYSGEIGYINSLNFIVENFKRPMEGLSRPTSMSADDVTTLFINLEELIPIHEEIIERFEKNEPTGKIFEAVGDRLLKYAYYCARLTDALNRLKQMVKKRDTAVFLDQLRKKSRDKFDLKTLLSLPMQKVPRYRLLLERLKENTKSEHSGYKSLSRSIALLTDIAKYINESSRDFDELRDCEDLVQSIRDYPGDVPISSYGKILCDGDVKIKRDGSERPEKRYIHLLEQALIVTTSDGKRGYGFLATIELKRMKPSLITVGNKSGIRLDADPDFEDLNCTLVFKTAKLRNEFHKTLMEAYEQLTPPSNRGHSWLLSSFSDPTKCSVCDHLLWGSVSQGYVCQHSGCTVMCHQMCLNASELSVCRQEQRRINHTVRRPPSQSSSSTPRIQLRAGSRRHPRMEEESSTDDPEPPSSRPTMLSPNHNAGTLSRQRRSSAAPVLVRNTAVPGADSSSSEYQNIPRGVRRTSRRMSSSNAQDDYINMRDRPQSSDYTNLKGIPSSKQERFWYVGSIARDESLRRFKSSSACHVGAFLVRYSVNKKAHVIDVLVSTDRDGLKHVNIKETKDATGNTNFHIVESQKFPTMTSLITHYRGKSLETHFPKIPTQLKHPVGDRAFPQPSMRVGQAVNDFDGNQDARELSLRKGETIEVLQERGTWVVARTMHGEGLVPKSFVS